MEKKTIGSFIAILRKAKGMTQKELAELLNVSDKAISRWERDESAPDITLLPILADIFGVTCDELLRGEKIGRESFEETTEKRTHRMKILLKKSRERFRAFSMISVAIALVGMVAALICNFIFHKATLGFYCALGCFLCALMAETAFYLLFKGEVDTEEIQSEELAKYRKYLRDHLLKNVYVIMVLLGICLPLLLLGTIDYGQYLTQWSESVGMEGFEYDTSGYNGAPLGKIQVGLQAHTWLIYGGFCGLAAATLCFIVDNVVKYFDRKHNRFGLTQEEIEREKRLVLRRVKYLLSIILLLGMTAGAAAAFRNFLPKQIVKGTTFESFEEFKEYIEKPSEGVAWGIEELRKQLDHYTKSVYGDNGEVLCEYTQLNDDVIKIEYGKTNKLPITTYTEENYLAAEETVQGMMWVWVAIGTIECVVISGLYRRKLNK